MSVVKCGMLAGKREKETGDDNGEGFKRMKRGGLGNMMVVQKRSVAGLSIVASQSRVFTLT